MRSTQDAVSSIQGPSAHRTVVSSMQGRRLLLGGGYHGPFVRRWHVRTCVALSCEHSLRDSVPGSHIDSSCQPWIDSSHRAECFLLHSSTCLSTPLRHLSEASFLLSGWSLQMPSAIFVIFTETRWFSCLSHKSILGRSQCMSRLGHSLALHFWYWPNYVSCHDLRSRLEPPRLSCPSRWRSSPCCDGVEISWRRLIDCFINPVRDAMVKVCPSVSLSPGLTRVFSPST